MGIYDHQGGAAETTLCCVALERGLAHSSTQN